MCRKPQYMYLAGSEGFLSGLPTASSVECAKSSRITVRFWHLIPHRVFSEAFTAELRLLMEGAQLVS